MPPTHKIGRALKTAALLPGRVAVKGLRARKTQTQTLTPAPGEQPLVILRLQVLKCEGLIAKDRGGTSDPFVTSSLLSTRHTTPVLKKTLNPVWNDAVYEFELFASLANNLGVLELVVWDKDTFGKDYLGEVGVALDAWFCGGVFDERVRGEGDRKERKRMRGMGWESEENQPFTLPLLSTRSHTVAQGTITIKLGFVLPPGVALPMPVGHTEQGAKEKYFEEVYASFVKRSRPSLVSAPPTEGVGTIRSHSSTNPLFVDDGGLSSDDDDESETHSVRSVPSSSTSSIASESGSESGSESESESESESGSEGGHESPSPDASASASEYEDALDEEERERMEREVHERVVNRALGLEGTGLVVAPRLASSGSATSTSTTTSATTETAMASSGTTTKGSTPLFSPALGARSTSRDDSSVKGVVPPLVLEGGKVVPPLAVECFKSPTTPTQEATLPTPTLGGAAGGLGGVGVGVGEAPGSADTVTAFSTRAQGGVGLVPPTRIVTKEALQEKSQSPPPPPQQQQQQRPSAVSRLSRMIPNVTRRLSAKSGKGSAGSSSMSLSAPLETVGGGASAGAGGALVSEPSSGFSSASASVVGGGGGGAGAGVVGDVGEGKGRKRRSKSKSGSKSKMKSGTKEGSFTGGGVTGGAGATGADDVPLSREEEGKRRKRVGRKKKKGKEYSLATGNDIVGIVMLEIKNAEDLPRLKNMTRTGWDMDPFVVVSFGKKVFRTRVIRHSRNPVWDEKLLFHVRRYEIGFKVHFSILDWDKLSANDHIGDASFDVKDLIDLAPQPDEESGLYVDDGGLESEMKDLKLKLGTGSGAKWEAKHQPELSIRAKFQPYAALRQKFWRQYLHQYDTDDTNTLSRVELTSMLDSLGSTLTGETIASFWTRFGKDEVKDELSLEEAIMCLETELCRPDSERKRVEAGVSGSTSEGDDPVLGGAVSIGDESTTASEVATPVVLQGLDAHGREIDLDELEGLDFSGRPRVVREESEESESVPTSVLKGVQGVSKEAGERKVPPLANEGTTSNQQPLSEVVNAPLEGYRGVEPAAAVTEKRRKKLRFGRKSKPEKPKDVATKSGLQPSGESSDSGMGTPSSTSSSSASPSSSTNLDDANVSRFTDSSAASTLVSSPPVERIINVKNCPMCHRPRMKSKAEVDIITHLAICASQDWGAVDKIMVGNFVTASQAQRKWYTKVLGRVGGGNYKLGANSANIIVQNRATGQLEEEKMQVYVRLGIRLLYKGAMSQMEGARARKLLKSLSIKQGIKYDSPASAAEIPGFIAFHNLDVNEVLDPLDSFKTFNEFFYRKLKSSARPVDSPSDPYRLVSAADCRFMAFESVSAATRIWIKGRDFSVSKLLGPEYKDDWGRYEGGALAIFRLAPQDYHRFHVPVDGRIGKMRYISGEYYTVNPQAIRTALDVYGENARKIVPMDSPQFGRVMAVCVGAMMVGSIETTVKEGQVVKRGDEFGYFAFGGSTIVILFEPGAVEWDEDLLINGRASLETLVRVNSGLGRGNRDFKSSVPGLSA